MKGQMRSFILVIVADWTRDTIARSRRLSVRGLKAIKDCLKNQTGLVSCEEEVKWRGYSPRRNDSFKPSIITQEITTQGYTVMAGFC